jgi:uncharacterized membrane protein HdeD (DUF308 family)
VKGQTEADEKHPTLQEFPFLVAILRGIFAILLGIVLLINPDKSRVFLANFMGFFWLTSGLLLLRHDSKEVFQALGRRTSLIIGLAGILAGLLMVTRSVTEHWVDSALLMQLLGIVILLTGVLHVVAEVRVARVRKGARTLAHFVLGVFEIILGAMMFISPLSYGPLTYLAATIWALVGGATIIGTAVYDRFKPHKQKGEGAETRTEVETEIETETE